MFKTHMLLQAAFGLIRNHAYFLNRRNAFLKAGKEFWRYVFTEISANPDDVVGLLELLCGNVV